MRVDLNENLQGWRPSEGRTDKHGHLIEDRIYNQKDFDRGLILEKRTGTVAAQVTKFLARTDPFQKTIVFCEDIDHAERMRQAPGAICITPTVGRVSSSYDNAMAETVIGLFKTEVIRRRGPWRHLKAVEFATLDWVDWFNHQRMLGAIGDIPPAKAEANFYDTLTEYAEAA